MEQSKSFKVVNTKKFKTKPIEIGLVHAFHSGSTVTIATSIDGIRHHLKLDSWEASMLQKQLTEAIDQLEQNYKNSIKGV